MNWKTLLTNPFAPKEPAAPLPIVTKGARKLPKKAMELLEESVQDYKSIMSKETKLTEDQQMELVEMIARFYPAGKINQHFVGKYKISISTALIIQYKRTKKWQPVIKKFREKYVTGVDEVAGMHKRVRLERADEIYTKAMDAGKLQIALQANRDQREEVTDKNSVGNVTLNQFNQFNSMSDEELILKREEILSKVKKAEVISDGTK